MINPKLNLLGITDKALVDKVKQEFRAIGFTPPPGSAIHGIWVKYKEYGFNFLRKTFPQMEDIDRSEITYVAIEKFIKAIIEEKYLPQKSAQSSTYFTTICRNTGINLLKKKGQIVIRENQKQSDEFVSFYEKEQLLTRELKEKAEEIIDDLLITEFKKEDCRKVIFYKYFEDKSHGEISKLMGYKTIQISKNKLSRCMRYLRNLIKKSKKESVMQLKKLYKL